MSGGFTLPRAADSARISSMHTASKRNANSERCTERASHVCLR